VGKTNLCGFAARYDKGTERKDEDASDAAQKVAQGNGPEE
jgi:hypothetical protein